LVGFALRGERTAPVLLGLAIVAALWCWAVLLPRMDALQAEGNTAGFAQGHALSMWMNSAEFLLALGLLVRAAVVKQRR